MSIKYISELTHNEKKEIIDDVDKLQIKLMKVKGRKQRHIQRALSYLTIQLEYEEEDSKEGDLIAIG